MKITLEKKITFGVSAMLICVMVVSTLFVSVVVNVQNRKASTEILAKSFEIAKDLLSDREKKLLADSRQISTIDNMGGKLGYLAESKGDIDFSLLKDTYAKITINTYNVGLAANIWKALIYDLHGDLISFILFDEKKATAGFTHIENGNIVASTITVKAGREMSDKAFQKSDMLKTLVKKYVGNLPSKENLYFKTIDNMICLVSNIPVMYEVYSKKTDSMVPAQAGVVMLIQKLDAGFVDKVARLGGTKVNIFSGKGLSVGNLEEYIEFDINGFKIADKKDISEQEIIYNDINLSAGNFFQGILPIYDQGNYIGTISSLYSKSIARENSMQMIKLLFFIALLCLLFFLPLTYFLAKSITKPILMIVSGLKDMAEGEGDLTKRLEVKTRDEVGELAKWFNAFLEKLQSIIKDISVNAETLNGASTDLSGLSHQMSEGTDTMSEKSNTVAAAAEEMSANINSVAAAMEQAATNINMVATATEEMTTTVNEIAQSSEKARAITAEAVSQAESASSRVNELGRAAQDIGKVTETINEISEQTNLLALNATIEAARAGEAGKGFAVVANEIKELARQTAEATQDIKVNIEGIQGTTAGTVTEIEQILTIINNVNEIVSNIAGAVEEQSVTTNEIAGNVSQASVGIQEVNQNVSQSSFVSADIAKEIAGVNKEAGEMSTSSSQVSINADELSMLAEQLKGMVGKFKV